jgi:hypothetical protein
MPASGANGVGGRHDARAHYEALLDPLLQGDVIEISRAHIAHRGKPRLESAFGIGHADDGPETIRELEEAVAAVARIAREVHVHVDESGQ